MEYEQLVREVHQRAHTASQAEAVAAIRATLQTLAERLAGGAAEKLAAELPREMREFLRKDPDFGLPKRLSLDEFYEAVAEREDVALPDAAAHARAVMTVMREAVSRGEWEKIRAQFPAEYEELFAAEGQRGSAGGKRARSGKTG